MTKGQVTIQNETGLHARPVSFCIVTCPLVILTPFLHIIY